MFACNELGCTVPMMWLLLFSVAARRRRRQCECDTLGSAVGRLAVYLWKAATHPNPLTLYCSVCTKIFKSEVGIWRGLEWSVELWQCGTRREARFAFVYTYPQRLRPLPLSCPKKTKSMPHWVEFLALATHSNSIRDPDENAFSVVLTSHSCLSPNPCPPHNPRHAPTMPINATPFSLNIIGPLSSCFIYFILFFPLHEPVFICVRRLFAGHLLIRH